MAENHPGALPALPEHPHASAWPMDVQTAYGILRDLFNHTQAVLAQEDGDPVQLRHLSEKIVNDSVMLLEGMERAGVPQEWIHQCAYSLGPLSYELEMAAFAAEGVERNKVAFLTTVEEVHSGHPGRPRKAINPEFLAEAMSVKRNITKKALADTLGIHRNTLRARLKEYGVQRQFSHLTNAELDELVRIFKSLKPESGLRYLIGFLRMRGLRVQKQRVMRSLRRVDSLGQALRRRKAVKRRKYSVPRPNYLWHCDGHHKLIWWGIVIHGFIDGYCRTVTGLRASTNNRAKTVLEVFLDAIEEYGVPSRVRGDRGGENVLVSVWMIMHRGPNRAFYVFRSSTRNTRIERLWVEVGTQFARRWRGFFTRLGRIHRLDRRNPAHLWLLHTLFLDEINSDCRDFQDEWNSHPIAGPKTNNRSPADMRFLGQATEGVYAEDHLRDVHPDTIDRYYGVDGEIRRRSHETGAGHASDEDTESDGTSDSRPETSDSEDELVEQIVADQAKNIRHKPVKVPRSQSPFSSAADQEAFINLVNAVRDNNIIPAHYGLLPDEWDDDVYPEEEVVRVGTRGKSFEVKLPHEIWYGRAVLWAQALDVLNRLQESDDNNNN